MGIYKPINTYSIYVQTSKGYQLNCSLNILLVPSSFVIFLDYNNNIINTGNYQYEENNINKQISLSMFLTDPA